METTAPENETITIANEHSRLVLEVEGGGKVEGTRIQQYEDGRGDHQRWRLKPVAMSDGEVVYNIENAGSGLSADVAEGSMKEGAEILQWPYGAGAENRQWKLIPVSGKEAVYKIQNLRSRLFLDNVDGNEVRQYKSREDGNGRQQWKLIGVIRRTGNRVWAWGENDNGRLGLGQRPGNVNENTAQRVLFEGREGAKAISIAAGSRHSLASLEDGSVWAWGSNGVNQLGIGRDGGADEWQPRRVRGFEDHEEKKAVAAGALHSLAYI